MPSLEPTGPPKISGDAPIVSIPEVRDYGRINPDLVELLDAGHRLVRLVGAERQRLLVSGLQGNWDAVVLIEGDAGPELAANLDAPNLLVVCLGSAADGAGLGMRGGRLLITGVAGDALAYAQRGGTIAVQGAAGHRAGLDRLGGSLILGAGAGRLLGDRQRGGDLWVIDGPIGPHHGHGRTGGTMVDASVRNPRLEPMTSRDGDRLREKMAPMTPWLGDDLVRRCEAAGR